MFLFVCLFACLSNKTRRRRRRKLIQRKRGDTGSGNLDRFCQFHRIHLAISRDDLLWARTFAHKTLNVLFSPEASVPNDLPDTSPSVARPSAASVAAAAAVQFAEVSRGTRAAHRGVDEGNFFLLGPPFTSRHSHNKATKVEMGAQSGMGSIAKCDWS